MMTKVLLSCLGWLMCVTAAYSQDFPLRPVHIVAAAAGGGGDFMARLIAPGMSAALGQPVVVDNRPTGVIATEIVAKAPPDGHTMLIGGASIWLFPLMQKASYDVARDFATVSLLVKEVFVLAVHPSLPVRSVSELIALAKKRPGALNYGSTGTGSSQHLGTELFKSMAGIDVVRVPYKAEAAAITALMSGELQMMISDAGLLAPHVKQGRLRALAVTSLQPSQEVPGLPTVAASGVPGYDVAGMTGIYVPANTPRAIVNRLNQVIVRILNGAEIKERVLTSGAEVVASTPEQFAEVIRADVARMSRVIAEAGLRVD